MAQQLGGQEEAKIGPPPAAPTVALKSPLTEAVENVPAGEGDPEYDEWIAAMNEWTEQTAEARATINTRLTGLTFDYGIQAWCLAYNPEDPDAAVWATEPPEDWQFAPALLRAGLSPSENGRLDFIFTKLIPRANDYLDVVRAIRAETNPLTNAEVEAQLGGFRSAGQSQETATGQGNQQVDVSRGDGSRKGVGAIARLLGKRNPR